MRWNRSPGAQARWRLWWSRFIGTVDLTPLLADHGFAPRTAFLSEFGNRLRKKVLPGTPETTDMAELYDLLLSSRFDVRWLKALDSATLKRLHDLLVASPSNAAASSDAFNHRLLAKRLDGRPDLLREPGLRHRLCLRNPRAHVARSPGRPAVSRTAHRFRGTASGGAFARHTQP